MAEISSNHLFKYR